MSNPERGSSQFGLRKSPRLLGESALRRSPRLLGKSAISTPKHRKISSRKSPAEGKSVITMPERRKISPNESPTKGKSAITIPECSQISPNESPAEGHGMTYSPPDSPDIETIMQADREYEAIHFRQMYTCSNDGREEKTCIHPSGQFDLKGNSYGITWVAVRGWSVTCVVFKKTLKPVKDRLHSYLQYHAPSITFDFLGSTIISDIEDLPSESSQKFDCGVHVHEPFAIVSVDPNTTNDQGDFVDKDAAVNYLKGIIIKDKFFFRAEAYKAAIRALELVFNQKFKPEDIWVHVAFFGEEQGLPSYTIKHLLADMNDGSG